MHLLDQFELNTLTHLSFFQQNFYKNFQVEQHTLLPLDMSKILLVTVKFELNI